MLKNSGEGSDVNDGKRSRGINVFLLKCRLFEKLFVKLHTNNK